MMLAFKLLLQIMRPNIPTGCLGFYGVENGLEDTHLLTLAIILDPNPPVGHFMDDRGTIWRVGGPAPSSSLPLSKTHTVWRLWKIDFIVFQQPWQLVVALRKQGLPPASSD
jgi:hypothetical protein